MSQVAVLLLLLVAAVLFGLAAASVPLGRFQPGWAGLLLLTVAVWLWPALAAAT